MDIDHNWSGGSTREATLESNCLFDIGARIRVSATLPENMRYFSSHGKVGTVTGRTLTTDYGIVDYGYYPEYVIHLDGEGPSAWYPESTLERILIWKAV